MLLDHRGEERWSARDLQQLMGYDEWRKFDDTISRAAATIEAAGMDPLDHIVGAAKVMETGRWGRTKVRDYRLTRFGAYHVTLAGDGRKPEVAAAKTYFAVKTREAELAAKPDVGSPEGVLALAEQYVAAAKELVATKKELAVAAPKAGKWDAFCDSDGLIDMGTAAKALTDVTGGLGRTKFMNRLRESDLRFLQVQNPRIPYEVHIQAGRAQVKMVQAGYQWVEQTFLTPKGLDWLVDRLGGTALSAA
ncbi:phage antirepressor KilAC domain-containing protein [Streptomyces californicus]|uniref:Phage antirepressor KilAC domain-containing protein n=1 Tax=Streptomyces californicus TaxID=67351 RepID=A0ABX7J273_9ACTN|nr:MULTISPECIES: phage antirepressor KilAC domain-containing protein [Streptomyces]QRV28785.1 phage antirepressor KilAC domain-containing protein [Streptomyces californicus]QRV42199.1 phage antirepressor KilAC domain-containing protein [Streptomyces californicus]